MPDINKMRLRNVPGSREYIEESPYAIKNPEELKGSWRTLFHKAPDAPMYVEIGTGKGQFISKHAENNPDIIYIGIEKFSSVIIRAIDKAEKLELDNLRFLRFDAEYIENIFAEKEVDKIYLNFSDPWPKDRHAKRRLTSSNYLKKYSNILSSSGTIEFKTDNHALFDFSIEQAKESGWNIDLITYDLHNSPYCDGNVMTEYEERFSSLGQPINKMILSR